MATVQQKKTLWNGKSNFNGEELIDMVGSGSENSKLNDDNFIESERSEIDGATRVSDELDVLENLTTVDVNAYAHKKTLAQGMMDLALLTANANQLRYVLETFERHPYYYPSLVLLILSIAFQIAVGVGLILTSRYNIEDKKEVCHAEKVSNYTICGIFIITVINVFISAFGVADVPTPIILNSTITKNALLN